MSTDTSLKTKTADAKRIPNPLYAAAGAGDLAYEQLRKLPARAIELTAVLRPVVTETVKEQGRKVDVDKLRAIAIRNADLLKEQAKTAQERAVAVYADLVARGEKVVGGDYKPMQPAGDIVQATVERQDAPSAETPGAASKSGPGTGKSPAKATKKTAPTAVK